MKIQLHAFEKYSRANGPGLRSVIWFQGCSLGCPDCFNPVTHDPKTGYEADTHKFAEDILSRASNIDGLTISGGEPFQQSRALYDLLKLLSGSDLSKIVFTGYTLTEINRMSLGRRILNHVDVLVAGRYIVDQHLADGLLGSANQNVHLLSSRYKVEDITRTPRCEVVLHSDGTITLSGIGPVVFL